MGYLGEVMALLTALCWVGTSISFEKAGRRIGSLAVNVIRIVLGFIFLTITSTISRSMPLPIDASGEVFTYLSISGFVGMFLGDLFLFEAFVLVGARVSMLIMSLAPVITSILAYIILGEKISRLGILGIFITVIGVMVVVVQRGNPLESKIKYSVKGIICALMGVAGEATGNVLSKMGVSSYDPVSSTQIRVMTAMIAFFVYITIIKKWGKVTAGLKDMESMKGLLVGSVVGPFLGVLFAIMAFKYAKVGVASTIMSINPVLVIPFSVYIMGERVNRVEVAGAVMAVVGVMLFFV